MNRKPAPSVHIYTVKPAAIGWSVYLDEPLFGNHLVRWFWRKQKAVDYAISRGVNGGTPASVLFINDAGAMEWMEKVR